MNAVTPSTAPPAVRVDSLAQMNRGGAWRLSLLHDRPTHTLVWITRGQGVALIDGQRRGLGVNNVLFIPARSLMSIDLGRQGFGLAVQLPPDAGLGLPRAACHLRLRDALVQTELTGILDAMQREQNAARPLMQEALRAEALLLSIWLRRAMAQQPDTPLPDAAARLVRAFSARVVADYASGAPMARFAADLGVTPTHLGRSCRRVAGLGAADFLVQRRLHAARLALAAPEGTIRAIARDLGFSGAPYFTRFIRQHTGRTPRGLR